MKALVNPFGGKSHKEMNDLIDAFMEKTKIDEIYQEHIRKGAFLAQDSEAFNDLREDGLQLKPEEKAALVLEDPKTGNKWNQPWILYALVGCCEYFPSLSTLERTVSGAPTSRFGSMRNADSKTSLGSLGAAVQGWDEVSKLPVNLSDWKCSAEANGILDCCQRR